MARRKAKPPERTFDEAMLRAFLARKDRPEIGCMELRVFGADWQPGSKGVIVPADRYSKTISGYYDDHDSLVVDAKGCKGISAYYTVNPVNPALIARADNRLKIAKKEQATSDKDIVILDTLYLDLDSRRPDGVSATHAELAKGLSLRDRILSDVDGLADASYRGISGNGGLVFINLPDYPNDPEHADHCHRFLMLLGAKYNTADAHVDVKTANPSRIAALPGTLKCKGDHTDDRPHRLVTIDDGGYPLVLPHGQRYTFDVRGWVEANGERIAGECGVREKPATAPGMNYAAHEGQGQGRGARNGDGSSAGTTAGSRAVDRAARVYRATAYMESIGPAISGQGGSDETFDVACSLIKGYDLTIDEARPILQAYSARCVPPWSDREIEHKLESAHGKHDDKPRGYKFDENRAGRHLNGSGNGYQHVPRPHYEQVIGPPPVDTGAINRRADELITGGQEGAARIEDLYRDAQFLEWVAQLESSDPAESEAVKAKLRRIPGYRDRAFQAAIKPRRDELANLGRLNAKIEQQANAAHGGGDGHGETNGPPPDFDLTDLGNGQRLAHAHGHVIRYCKAYGDWLIYDGARWGKDDWLKIEVFAQEVPARIIAETHGTPDEVMAYQEWAKKSQAKERMEAAVKVARSMVTVTPQQLDRDPWLLNVRNGTVDLRTGECRPHDPNDLITKIAHVEYDPAATCPRWDRFMLEIMNGNRELVDYLKRAVGYSITGVVREHVFFFLYGTGRNGKGTFLNTIHRIIGDYSSPIDNSILITQNMDQHPTALTDLEGRRFVYADEADDGRRLAEAQVKMLTGGNPIRARRMREDFYTFYPSHHIFFAANHKPEIRGGDPGIWRRVKLIPFERKYDPTLPNGQKPDLALDKKLLAEASGIFNWMIEGCREWQAAEENGLQEPEVIRSTVRTYHEEMDVLGGYIEERCMKVAPEQGGRSKLSELHADYVSWCVNSSNAPLSVRRFSNQLSEKGYVTWKANSVVWKLGVRLKTHGERSAEHAAADEVLNKQYGAVGGSIAGRTPEEPGEPAYQSPYLDHHGNPYRRDQFDMAGMFDSQD